MEKRISFIYANRNRDLERIQISFRSLEKQHKTNFEVLFVDYGSRAELVKEYKNLENEFPFVRIFFLPVSQLLWNKSKALNFGIKKALSPTIFIADVDLIFHPETTAFLEDLQYSKKFFLFRLGYLGKEESGKLLKPYEFANLKPERLGAVNGMVFSSKESMLEVYGLDEFFHFYGAEDEDLFARLENARYEREERKELYFYHNWHQSFSGSEDKLLTHHPRVKNIMRINQRHFLNNRENKVIKPLRQEGMGEFISEERSRLLDSPTKTFQVYNILAHIEHCLREEIPAYKGEILRVDFVEDPYYSSWKHKAKKILGKQTQPYCSMKEVNDMVLKEILFRYRDENYSFKIGEDLRTLTFCIDLS